ncbi:LysR substrate-binding domain-containing protein [Variovorax dokdonensis]|uniref:LysR substrate-binding domain-containing protein n=1 Tax=Variovorax dokdonensis TaxID=344883 RepID=A0ABT7N786_9BURK|nr:LysR family transcriptional regulator [Variovorax dokdonensis]MDM0043791.1 LysR substrate-binding domain-containing protein [Variovorax dokdonensis]
MRQPELSTRQLRAFLALAEQRNFTRAAAQCHLSQPAFSALIRTLEDSLGARLFDRDTRRVVLTPEGELFDASARRLLEDMGTALLDLAEHVQLRKGRVRVAALPSLAAGWLPGVFAEFMQMAPGIRVDLKDALSDACIAMLRAGDVDFALAATGADTSAQGDLRARRLCADNFHLVCRADHPLANETRLTARKLAPWPFIQMARNSSVRQALDAALHPMRMNAVFEVEHLATVTGLVEAGLGISVVPALTLFHFRREGIVTRPLALPGLKRTLYLVQRREGSLSVAAQALADLVVARLGALKIG